MAEQAVRPHEVNRLGTDRIGKLLLEFSIPAIVSMVFNLLYNVIDTIVLFRAIGEVGAAVTTVALPVFTILMGFSALPGQGGTALAAIQLGEKKTNVVERTLGNTTVLLIGFAVIVAVAALFFMDPVLSAIGTPQNIWTETKTFVMIICVGFVFQSLGMGLNNFLRAAGKPNFALGASVLGTIMCVVFNILFVLVLGWGIAGSAIATLSGQFIGMIPVLWFFIASKSAPFRLKLSCCKPDIRLMGKILSLGLASFAMQVASTVVGIVFNHVMNIYGAMEPIGVEGALAAVGVAQRATMIAFSLLVGLIMGAQPIIGYNYGAKSWQRVLSTLKWASIVGVVIGSVFFVVSHLAPGVLIDLFGVNEELHDFAALSLQIYTVLIPLVGYQIVGASYFQSSGQPFKAAILELTRQVIFLIPMYIILPLVLPQIFGISGLMSVIIAIPVSDALSIIVTTAFVVVEVRKLRRWRDEGAGKLPDSGAVSSELCEVSGGDSAREAVGADDMGEKSASAGRLEAPATLEG